MLSAELDACIANCLALNVVWIGLIAAQPLMRDKEGVLCEGMEMLVITMASTRPSLAGPRVWRTCQLNQGIK